MSGRSSRNKGSGAEREVAKILEEGLGIDVCRTPRSGAWEHAKGDLFGVPNFNIEVKRQERTRIEEWYQQSVEDAKASGDIPLVIYRQSRKPWKVVISLSDFIAIMRSHIADLDLARKGTPIDLGGSLETLDQTVIKMQKEQIIELQRAFVDAMTIYNDPDISKMELIERDIELQNKLVWEKKYLEAHDAQNCPASS